MRNHEIAQHFREKIIQVRTGGNAFDERLIAFFRHLQVETVRLEFVTFREEICLMHGISGAPAISSPVLTNR